MLFSSLCSKWLPSSIRHAPFQTLDWLLYWNVCRVGLDAVFNLQWYRNYVISLMQLYWSISAYHKLRFSWMTLVWCCTVPTFKVQGIFMKVLSWWCSPGIQVYVIKCVVCIFLYCNWSMTDSHDNIFCSMMTSSNGNSFRDTGPLCGEFTGHRWIPHTKAGDAEL